MTMTNVKCPMTDGLFSLRNRQAGLIRWQLCWAGNTLRAVYLLVGNQIAREDFDNVLSGTDYWSDIQTYMYGARDQALLFDFISCQTKGENRADHRNGLD